MKQILSQIPDPLRRKILLRLLWSIPGTGMLVAALYTRSGLHTALPGLMLILLSLAAASALFARCAAGRYVIFTGECVAVERTPIRRTVRVIRIRTAEREVILHDADSASAQVREGDTLTVYVASSVPVYDQDAALVVFQALAISRD